MVDGQVRRVVPPIRFAEVKLHVLRSLSAGDPVREVLLRQPDEPTDETYLALLRTLLPMLRSASRQGRGSDGDRDLLS